MRHLAHRALAVTATIAGLLTLAAAADASITPSVKLNQSTGTAAGSTTNLGLDLTFADSGTDSPHNLTINLPAGLLANASINGGSCLKTAITSGSACQVGSGTVTATADPIPPLVNLPVPVSVPVSFYLVPPPAPGDLAGLAVEGLGEQIGQTGDIRVRPTGDPNGVGVTIKLVLPDQLPLTLPIIGEVPTAFISLTEINSTFDRLRYPASCPATQARLSVSADSYSDPSVHTATAPLAVTGCSSLPYSPVFKATATRDSGDRQVKLATTITQGPTQAPSRSVSLAFPQATLGPNLESIRALCLNLASGTCATVGSATATSPLYPSALTGTAYLTGSSSGLSLTLVFPSPFPLTLTGAVDLARNAATFTGLPDIPLTNLGVNLDGGPEGLFLSTCQTPSGTATATLTDQNGDKTARVPAAFTVSGCPGTSGTSGGGSAGGGSTGSTGNAGSRNGSTTTGVTVGHTTDQPRPLLRPGHRPPRSHVQDERGEGLGQGPRADGRAARRPEVRRPSSPRRRRVRERGEDQVARCLRPASHDQPATCRRKPHRGHRPRRTDRERRDRTRRQGPQATEPRAHHDRPEHARHSHHHPGADQASRAVRRVRRSRPRKACWRGSAQSSPEGVPEGAAPETVRPAG